MRGEQRLVGGDHVGARVEREHQVFAGRLDAAHQLDDDVGAEDQRARVGGEQLLRDVGGARGVEVAHRDTHQFETRADPARELVAVLEQQRATWAPTAPAPSRAMRRLRYSIIW